MKRLYLIVAMAGTVSFALPSASYANGWMRTYGGTSADYGNWVEQTSDGGYIIAGSLGIPSTEPRAEVIYLIKTDSLGDTLWTRRYPEEGNGRLGNWGECVQQTSDGGYIVAGTKKLDEAWLIKTDSAGNTLWSRTYPYQEAEAAYCVRQTNDEGYIITGSKNTGHGLFFFKIDKNGDTLWTRTYVSETNDVGYSLQLTPDGGYVIAGCRGKGVLLLKTDEQGDSLWSQTYEDGDTTLSDYGYCVELTSDGGYVISGAANFIVFGQGALWLLKTDSAGDTLWTKVYDYGEYGEVGKSVKQTPDGGYIIAGVKDYSMFYKTHALWLLRTDSAGDTLWTRTYGEGSPPDDGRCVQLTSDGGYVITGFTQTYSPDGSADVWLIKTDSLGCVGIKEEDVPIQNPDVEATTTVGSRITLRYADHPAGFHAEVFDALGRKVDEIHNTATSGTITWPVTHQSPGVYFIKIESPDNVRSQKVIIIK